MNDLERERIALSIQLLQRAEPRPIGDLIPYERNQKTHDARQIHNIATSLRRFGWRQPIVADARGVIVIGHGRWAAAKELGLESVPVVDAADLTEDEIRELRIIDNKTNESPWNEFLEQDLRELSFEGFDLFDDENREDTQKALDEVVEDEPPETPENPTAKRGQIWQMGRHRLMCGDSTDPEDVQALTEGIAIDLLLTDPPYNVDVGSCERPHSKNNGVSIQNDKMPEDVFIGFLTKALANAENLLRPGGAYYIFYAGLHHIEFESAVRNIPSFKLHEQLVWVKSHFVLGRNSDYQWMHEPCLYGWKAGAEHYFTDSRAEGTVIEDARAKLSTMKKGELIALCERLMGRDGASTVLRADKPSAADLHPTVKPQELLARLILNSSKPGWNVLDLFGGSGSTMIACQQTGRACYTMEIDPHYCDVIVRRWEQFTGEAATLVNP